MVAGNVARIIRAPGRLVVNPTTAFATTAYPYGGTEVGKVRLCLLQPLGTQYQVEYESLGAPGDILEPDNHFIFTCFLRGWDDDAVQRFFQGSYEVGSVTRHAVFAEPGNRIPGMSALSRSISLAFVPDDLIHSPGILIYNGVPTWTAGAEVAFQHGSELGIPLAVDCLHDSNSNILRVGRLPDLSLT